MVLRTRHLRVLRSHVRGDLCYCAHQQSGVSIHHPLCAQTATSFGDVLLDETISSCVHAVFVCIGNLSGRILRCGVPGSPVVRRLSLKVHRIFWQIEVYTQADMHNRWEKRLHKRKLLKSNDFKQTKNRKICDTSCFEKVSGAFLDPVSAHPAQVLALSNCFTVCTKKSRRMVMHNLTQTLCWFFWYVFRCLIRKNDMECDNLEFFQTQIKTWNFRKAGVLGKH